MPRNGSGTYTAPSNSFNPAVNDTTVDPDDWNDQLADYETAFTDSLSRSGQGGMLADLDLGTFSITNASAISAISLLVSTTINKVTITTPATAATLTIANNGSLITSGGFPLTLTIAATANATIPSGTHTLVATDVTATLTNKTFDSAGTGNTLKVSGVTLSAGQYPGTTTNDGATTGNVGETITQQVLAASAVSMSTNTATNIATISILPGDWDVYASGDFSGTTVTVTGIRVSISNTSATENTTAGNFASMSYGAGISAFSDFNVGMSVAPVRVTLSATASYWMVSRINFSGGTASGYGQITARRRR